MYVRTIHIYHQTLRKDNLFPSLRMGHTNQATERHISTFLIHIMSKKKIHFHRR